MAETANLIFNNEKNIEVTSGVKKYNQSNFLSIQKIKEHLNWSPRFDLEKSLIDMKEAYEIRKD